MTSFLTARPPRLRPQGVTGRHLRTPRGAGPRQGEGRRRRHGIYRRSDPEYPLVSVITVYFNADDHYHPKAIELLVRARAVNGADVVGGMISFHRVDGSLMRPFGRLEFGPRSLVWMSMWLETLLIPTAVLDNLGAFDTRFHVAADTDLGARLYAAGYSY